MTSPARTSEGTEVNPHYCYIMSPFPLPPLQFVVTLLTLLSKRDFLTVQLSQGISPKQTTGVMVETGFFFCCMGEGSTPGHWAQY